jgi:hypothetical protein
VGIGRDTLEIHSRFGDGLIESGDWRFVEIVKIPEIRDTVEINWRYGRDY